MSSNVSITIHTPPPQLFVEWWRHLFSLKRITFEILPAKPCRVIMVEQSVPKTNMKYDVVHVWIPNKEHVPDRKVANIVAKEKLKIHLWTINGGSCSRVNSSYLACVATLNAVLETWASSEFRSWFLAHQQASAVRHIWSRHEISAQYSGCTRGVPANCC